MLFLLRRRPSMVHKHHSQACTLPLTEISLLPAPEGWDKPSTPLVEDLLPTVTSFCDGFFALNFYLRRQNEKPGILRVGVHRAFR